MATDIYDTIAPIHTLSAILGLSHLIVTQHKSKRQLVSNLSPTNFIGVVLIVTSLVWVAIELEKHDFAEGLIELALHVELYLGTLMTLVVFTFAIWNREIIIKIFILLTVWDERMKQMEINISYQAARKWANIETVVILSAFAIKVGLQFLGGNGWMVIIYSVFNLIDFVNTVMLLQYVNLMLLVWQRYVCLNNAMKQLNNDVRVGSRTNFGIVQVIRKYGQIHNGLNAITRKICRTFGVSLLITVLARFIMVTTQLIYLYKVLNNPKKAGAATYALHLLYLFMHSWKLLMIASASSSTSSQARRASKYLHTIWKYKPEIHDELQFFSLQVLHHSRSYNVCGFFDINYSLMTSITGAITSYLIIVIQFDKSYPSDD